MEIPEGRSPFIVYCSACRHEWTLFYTPIPVSKMRPFEQPGCPMCFSTRVMCGQKATGPVLDTASESPQNCIPTCLAVNGGLVLKIGAENLANAAAFHPMFEHREGRQLVEILNEAGFAREVARVINEEDANNGSTLFTRMLDKAIELAVDGGCEGVAIREEPA